jgi:hypothetical protein
VGVAQVIEGSPIISAATPVPISTVECRDLRRRYGGAVVDYGTPGGGNSGSGASHSNSRTTLMVNATPGGAAAGAAASTPLRLPVQEYNGDGGISSINRAIAPPVQGIAAAAVEGELIDAEDHDDTSAVCAAAPYVPNSTASLGLPLGVATATPRREQQHPVASFLDTARGAPLEERLMLQEQDYMPDGEGDGYNDDALGAADADGVLYFAHNDMSSSEGRRQLFRSTFDGVDWLATNTAMLTAAAAGAQQRTGDLSNLPTQRTVDTEVTDMTGPLEEDAVGLAAAATALQEERRRQQALSDAAVAGRADHYVVHAY